MDDVAALEWLSLQGISIVDHAPRQAVHIVVQPRIRLSFDAAPSAVQEVDIDRDIDATNWTSGVLIVRLYQKSAWDVGSTLSILVRRASRVEDVSGGIVTGTSTAFVQFTSTTVAPRLFVAAFSAPIPANLAVVARLVQTTRVDPVLAQVGIELIGRTPARLRPEVSLPSVARPRRGIVESGTPPVLYREPWGATTAPWRGAKRTTENRSEGDAELEEVSQVPAMRGQIEGQRADDCLSESMCPRNGMPTMSVEYAGPDYTRPNIEGEG